MGVWSTQFFNRAKGVKWSQFNAWDVVAFVLVIGLIGLLAWAANQMTAPYQLGESIPISLAPSHLPYYALRTVLRMLIAMVFSLGFTFTFATWAAKSKHAERIIIPFIDIMQSVPILGFLSIVSIGLIALFPHSLLGPECASIFVIFTSQVWNMALSFYQSVKTVPVDLREAATMFRLSRWQTFWRVEAPFAMPGLVWNMMMSMSASWFFVVASEAFTVSNQQITLPGIGSYIFLAGQHANIKAIVYAIITMVIVIFLYDQLLFRPLVSWSTKFKAEQAAEEEPGAWLVDLFQRTRLVRQSKRFLQALWDAFVNISLFNRRKDIAPIKTSTRSTRHFVIAWYVLFFSGLLSIVVWLSHMIFTHVPVREVPHVFLLGCYTGIRVMSLIIISSLIWVPVGVWIGMRPNAAKWIQPIVQFFAAFPANLFFPVAAVIMVTYHLNVQIWTSPLMILGTQWYILFNVIAGAASLPKELKMASRLLQLRGWLRWRRFILPGILPYYITGAITAAGGAWNASIVAEVVNWGRIHIHAAGLGAYIVEHSGTGDFAHLALGVIVMCIFVLAINQILWRPLYNWVSERYKRD